MPMVIATLSEVAEALQYLHSQGFIHCDLKPENILLKVAPGDNRGFTAKVSDFGLSDLSTSEGLLMGELGGTVTHLDPCIVTQRKVSKKSDVYSFGICMWELYTGQRPYIELLQSSKDKRSRDKLILSKVAHEHKRPVFPPYAPPDFVALATQCWHPDPAARPAFQEVLAELRIMQDRHGYVTAPLTIPNGTPPLGP
ncbi:protein kinase domain-containing protein, partial [Haematococcus lacustris]